MTYEEYVASMADVSWQYTAAGTISYAGRIYNLSVERVAHNLCYLTYTVEMVTKGGDNARWMAWYDLYSLEDSVTPFQWHGQIEDGFYYRNTFRHSFSLDSVNQATKTLAFYLGMEDISENRAWSAAFNKTVNIPDWASYTVVYDANGGSGAPASQTKWKDVNLTLQSGSPTRSGHQFLGWNTAQNGSGTPYASGGTYSANAGVTLYAQWKALASVLTTPISAIAGTAIPIFWARYNNSYKHTLEFEFGNVSGTIVSDLVADNTAWTPNLNLCAQIPNAINGTGTLTLKTYNGTTLLGTSTATFTLNVPASVVPSFNYALSEGQASGFGVYATGLSKLRAVLTTAGVQGSTVVSASLTIDGKTYSGSVTNNSVTLNSDVLMVSGTRTVAMTVTDSRGRTATQSTTITVYEYFAPSIGDIGIAINGTTVAVTVIGNVAPVNNLNVKFLTIKKVRISDQTETTVLARESQPNYAINKTVTETVSDIVTESYMYKVYLEDTKYSGLDAVYSEKITGIICISRYAGGRGAAFFKEATRNGVDIAGDLFVSGTIEGNLNGNADTATKATEDGNGNNIAGTYMPKSTLADYVVAQGTETVGGFTWRYRKWNSGQAELQGAYNVSNFPITYQSGSLYYNSKALPTLPSWFNPANIQIMALSGSLAWAKCTSSTNVQIIASTPISGWSGTLWIYERGSWS